MPPMKHSNVDEVDIITDSYYTNLDSEPIEIGRNGFSIKRNDAEMLSVIGKNSGLYFRMTKADYTPECNNSRMMIVTDNGEKNNYNKQTT